MTRHQHPQKARRAEGNPARWVPCLFLGELICVSATLTVLAAKTVIADSLVINADDSAELQTKWCVADPNVDHIFVLRSSLFVDSKPLLCGHGPYKLYRIVERDDPDDFEYYIDPPPGDEKRLGCDGKAGRKMETIAVNCRPE